MKTQGFPAGEKLKKKTDIDVLFQKGKWKSKDNLRLIFLVKEQGFGKKIGVSVSKKNFKRATDRNRIKRLLREIYRLNKAAFYDTFGADFLLMIFYNSPILPTGFKELETAYLEFLTQIKNSSRKTKPDNTLQ